VDLLVYLAMLKSTELPYLPVSVSVRELMQRKRSVKGLTAPPGACVLVDGSAGAGAYANTAWQKNNSSAEPETRNVLT
jgi:hypothetical protein